DRTHRYWYDLNAGDLGLTDAGGWNQPQYYSTLRLADINGDRQAELIIRGAAGLSTYAFNPTSGRWYNLNAGTLGFTDVGGWNQPQYYRTLRLADINGDGQSELLVRGADGLHTFTFNRANSQWQDIGAPIQGLGDSNNWNQSQYYETIRTADINGDGQDELIFRGPYGLFAYIYDRTHKYWYDLNAGDLGFTDTGGWNQPQFYSTLQLADINGDGQAELLVRGTDGLLTLAFDTNSQKWVNLGTGPLGLTDSHHWDNASYYSTIQAADIDGDGQAELLARSDSGLISWHYIPASPDLPLLFQAANSKTSSGYEVSYRFDPDPALPNGVFSVQQIVQVPSGDSSIFTCRLVNSQGHQLGSPLQASTANAGAPAPFPLSALPGRFAIAYLNRQNSDLPDLVIPILLPDELATRANQSRLTFIWSPVPANWQAITTIINNQVALICNGNSVYADIGNPDNLQITNQITLQAWIKPTARDGLRNIIAHGYNAAPAGEVYLRIANGQYQVGSWDSVDHFAASPMPLSDLGRWVHLSGTYDGTRWILYRNGQPVATSQDATGAVQVQASWAMGARGGGGERFYSGLLRRVAIWKTYRTAQQVMNDMLSSPDQNDPDLAVYWPLDDGRSPLPNDQTAPPDVAGSIGQDLRDAPVMGATTSPWFEPQSLDPLVMLPQIPLTSFTTAQQGAFTIISANITSGSPAPGNNIRRTYVNQNNFGNFSGWSTTLRNSTPPSWASIESWNSADWQVVRNTLASELENVTSIWQLYNHTNALLDHLLNLQGDTLVEIANKLNAALTTPQVANDTTGYLVSTILSGALAILSVIPEAKVAQMAFLAGSDITASLLSASSDQPTLSALDPTLPQQIKDQLNASYQALLKLNGERITRILTDGQLLPVVSRLAETVWNWQPGDFGMLPSLVQDKYRLSFYQQLIPNQYVVSEWLNHLSPGPSFYPDYEVLPSARIHGAPEYACWSTQSSQLSQRFNLYIIHTITGPFGSNWGDYPGFVTRPIVGVEPQYYPTEAILNELFQTLGVAKADFFTCTNGWEKTPFTALMVPIPPSNLGPM
ncbi:MAG TPA: LamG-like jellyroll fold domain-containing protein, partial [Ktedonobacteraceae bacterium]|nr:LamG-like jellyroll fold domain-containing protein [Ktedonobacteraceae bacterium]